MSSNSKPPIRRLSPCPLVWTAAAAYCLLAYPAPIRCLIAAQALSNFVCNMELARQPDWEQLVKDRDQLLRTGLDTAEGAVDGFCAQHCAWPKWRKGVRLGQISSHPLQVHPLCSYSQVAPSTAGACCLHVAGSMWRHLAQHCVLLNIASVRSVQAPRGAVPISQQPGSRPPQASSCHKQGPCAGCFAS